MHTPDVSTPARAAAVAIEDMIRRKPAETGVLIDVDGKTIFKRLGKGNRVSVPVHILRGARGMTFTHNHPDGNGLSLPDVEIGMEFELAEVRVVTERYRHGVSMLARRLLAPLSAGFQAAESGAIVAVRDDMRRGLVHPLDFGPEVRDRTWQRLSSSLGFNYWRQES